jgi:hypothetical protein
MLGLRSWAISWALLFKIMHVAVLVFSRLLDSVLWQLLALRQVI